MRIEQQTFRPVHLLYLAAIGVVLLAIALVIPRANAAQPSSDERLVTIHDRGIEKSVITKADTLRDVFSEADIVLDTNDLVEPGLDEELVTNNYQVNVYRARPIVIIDGSTRQLVMTAYQTPKQIAKHAGIELYDEDVATLELSDDIITDGASMRMVIDRATPVDLTLYGNESRVYTRTTSVQAFLDEKNISLASADTLSVSRDAQIEAGMDIEIWRNGKQRITKKEVIKFPVKKILDADRPVGYKRVVTPGENGKKMVTYDVVMKNGKQVSRKAVQTVIVKKASQQVEVVGVKSTGGLTKAKGVMMFTDSDGVVHRETYYDLPMNVVMRNCGGDGSYDVREDGAKVDKKGYVIIAANLAKYPRCSVVETSLGPAKVYDTGGFAAVHPHGYDLATDWSKADGI